MAAGQDLVCQTIYEYFEARILTGRYLLGEKLPSIQEIAKAFQLAPETIRSALLLLAENGYIRMEAKQGSWVVYPAAEASGRNGEAVYFAQRADGIQDLLQSGKVLLRPILTAGVLTMTNEDWDRLRAWEESRTDQPIVPASIQLYAQLFATLRNPLILNLFWEVDRYLRFTSLCDWDVGRALAPCFRTGDRNLRQEALIQALEEADTANERRLLTLLEAGKAQEYAEESIPFVWTIYRQRQQLCYTLAAGVIRKIAEGVYPLGSYLPPLSSLAQQLGVSVSTLRRTLSLLGSLGVTRSLHGKGTLVCREIEKIDFCRPEIREGLRYFWESLQLVALTIRPVTLSLLEAMTEPERTALTHRFDQMCELNTCHHCFDITLDVIVRRHPQRMVRECYGKIQEFLAWGYPFAVHRLHNRPLQEEYADTIRQAADRLIQRDWEGFAEQFEALMRRETRFAEKILNDYCGIGGPRKGR